MRGCAAPSTTPIDFEEMNKQLFFGQYKRDQQLFRRHRTCLVGPAAKARNCRSSRRCATRCRPRSSPRPINNPVGGNPEAVRANLRESDAAVEGSRLRDHATASWSIPPASRSASNSWSRIRPTERVVAVLQAVAGTHRRDRHRSAPSTTRSIRTGCAVSISTSSPICGRESLSPGNEQREFWGSQAADRPGSQQSRRHQESRRSMR